MHDEALRKKLASQAKRMRQADADRPGLLRQTVYLGTLGLLFAVPMVAGAYLGRWLDGMAAGYSMRWTLSLIILGIGVGAFNVYWFVKE